MRHPHISLNRHSVHVSARLIPPSSHIDYRLLNFHPLSALFFLPLLILSSLPPLLLSSPPFFPPSSRRASLLMSTSIIFSPLTGYCTPTSLLLPTHLPDLLPPLAPFHHRTLSAAVISERHSRCSCADSRTI